MKIIDVVEVLVHWHAGRPMGELCSSLRIDPKTVRKYTAPAIAAGLVPGGPSLSSVQWSALVEGWFPELSDRSLRQSTWGEIEPHRERIKGWLGVVKISTIHQRLRDDLGLQASESSLRRFIWANFEEEVARDAVRVLRDTPPAGDEAQVDYGLLGRWADPVTGRVRRVWGFIMVLCFSRLMFLRPVLKMDEQSWVEAHVLAFEFFGGAVARVVPDNLKTGVIKPDLYDPLINKAFGEFALHYDTLIDPARLGKPRDKGRVERPVPYARDSFFAGRESEFKNMTHMCDEALRWCREVANLRQCRPLERIAPQVLFDAEEKDALLPLPTRPFELARWSTPTVYPDIHIFSELENDELFTAPSRRSVVERTVIDPVVCLLLSHAEFDRRRAMRTSVDLGELVLGTGKAHLKSFDFADPAFPRGLSDAVIEVVADLEQSRPLSRVRP